MCDTFSVLSSWTGRDESFFAKNSDREPGEVQVLRFIPGSRKDFLGFPCTEDEAFSVDGFYNKRREKYLLTNYKNLKRYLEKYGGTAKEKDTDGVEVPLDILISQPLWMWGGEMGVNEAGVAIGNEAVFPKIRPAETAILGMDILRMALHFSPNAERAKDLICSIVEECGQGGDGGYRHRSVYHNSFLIQDAREAYVVETAGKECSVRKVKNYCSISNTYLGHDECNDRETPISVRTVRDEIVKAGFKEKYESKLYNYFAKGEIRNRYKNVIIKALGEKINLGTIKGILRSHRGDIKYWLNEQTGENSDFKSLFKPRRGMTSICIHSGTFIKSETTASLIVHYIGKRFVVWYTGSSFPCVSIYKPIVVSSSCKELEELSSLKRTFEKYRKRQKMSLWLESNYSYFVEKIKPIRDRYERIFMEIVYDGITEKRDDELCRDILKCHELEVEYMKRLDF